jgi:hypothetical protein
MGMKLIYGLILLLIISITAICFFVYSRKKKSKIGQTISILILLLLSLVLLTNTIDEFCVSKKDIVSNLGYIDIELEDDFEIINNNVEGMPERNQKTEIKISQRDKDRIISKIKSSINFKSFANEQELINDTDTEQFGTSNKIFNFKYPQFYSREINTKIDNYPTRLFLTIYEKSNLIKYQRIED